MVNDGGSAFPEVSGGESPHTEGCKCGSCPDGSIESFGGMSLRDYFAGKIIAAMLMRRAEHVAFASVDAAKENMNFAEYMAQAAYEYADAMLKERRRA